MTRMQLRKNKRGPFFKKWWFWLIVIVIIAAGVGFGLFKHYNNDNSNKYSESTSKKVEKPKSSANTTKKKSNSNESSNSDTKKITLEQFNNIALDATNGTTWDTIKPIFGTPVSHTTANVQDTDVDVQNWDNVANSTSGAMISIGFTANHAVSKTITNLKVTRSSKIDIQKFAEIESDLSEDQVTKILGKPNSYNASNINGNSLTELTYSSDIKGDSGAKIVITLTNGKVSKQVQNGVK